MCVACGELCALWGWLLAVWCVRSIRRKKHCASAATVLFLLSRLTPAACPSSLVCCRVVVVISSWGASYLPAVCRATGHIPWFASGVAVLRWRLVTCYLRQPLAPLVLRLVLRLVLGSLIPRRLPARPREPLRHTTAQILERPFERDRTADLEPKSNSSLT